MRGMAITILLQSFVLKAQPRGTGQHLLFGLESLVPNSWRNLMRESFKARRVLSFPDYDENLCVGKYLEASIRFVLQNC
jgi:hypothetical protein